MSVDSRIDIQNLVEGRTIPALTDLPVAESDIGDQELTHELPGTKPAIRTDIVSEVVNAGDTDVRYETRFVYEPHPEGVLEWTIMSLAGIGAKKLTPQIERSRTSKVIEGVYLPV